MISKSLKEFHFLVNVNLPKKINFVNTPYFTHIVGIDPMMTDEEIWVYAIKTNKVILAEDADFYDKFMYSDNYSKSNILSTRKLYSEAIT